MINRGTIRNSYATGYAYGSAGDDFVGGLVGESENRGIIQDSYATGKADGGAGNDSVGGLVGRNNGGTIRANASWHATGGTADGGRLF